jgi:predicted nucleic acid-binding protein
VTRRRQVRLFLDSNVLLAGILSARGLDGAILSLCTSRVCRLVLAEVVRDEVEENLLFHAARMPAADANRILDAYGRLIKLAKPELVPYPSHSSVRASRHLIRHEADVPVLLSAVASRPDWLLTHNIRHFTNVVARRCSLRIATPGDFFRQLSDLFG